MDGIIRKYFGKQTLIKTKPSLHDITSKAALQLRSETWIMKKRKETNKNWKQHRLVLKIIAWNDKIRQTEK